MYIGTSGDTLYGMDTAFASFLGMQTGVGSITAMDLMIVGSVLAGNAAGKVTRYDAGLTTVLGQCDFGVPITSLAGEVVPEPASLTALAAGLVGLPGLRRRKS